LPVLAIGVVGYLIGGWHPAVLGAKTDLSAADVVALRFPQQWDAASPATVDSPAVGVVNASPARRTDNVELALLDPEPMAPQAGPEAVARGTDNSIAVTKPQLAAGQATGSPPALAPSETPRTPPPRPAAVHPAGLSKASPPAVQRRPLNRPDYMLNDAQIASIKERLHLTPDQERMWPAVEAALRNIAYKRVQEARRRDGRPDGSQVAFDSEAVEGLKSAAVPLIMSFNDEQKQEVRDVAHVMGLDQLAAQF
jgi:zinc resistance-associated protein